MIAAFKNTNKTINHFRKIKIKNWCRVIYNVNNFIMLRHNNNT